MKQLSQWLDYIDQVHTRPIDLTLDRVHKVYHLMQLTPVPYKVITVAGTNGKGTSSSLLELIYRRAGYRTGLYMSPHLLKFNERIRFNGVMATDEQIIEGFMAVDAVCGKTTLTYFEYAVLAGLYCFQQTKLDILILEIGLGGRRDSCNIVDPDVAMITTIDLDHMETLGDTRELIGTEKAGIFRPNTPAICGDYDCPQSVIQCAKELQAPLYQQQHDFTATIDNNTTTWSWRSKNKQYANLPVPHIPVQNASTCLMAVQCMQSHLAVESPAIVKALQDITVPGRYQKMQLHCPVIIDVAHNVAAMQLLAKNLQKDTCHGNTIAVFSALKDKDVHGMVATIDPFISVWHYAELQDNRALSGDELNAAFTDINTQKKAYLGIEQAFAAALASAATNDRIIIFGSFVTVAALWSMVQQHSVVAI